MSVTADQHVTQSNVRRWAYRVTPQSLDAWIVIADSSNGHIDIKPGGRGMVYIRPDEQDAFQLCYDQARTWLAEQEEK